MAIFESESWLIAEGKHKEHDEEMHRWFKWVNAVSYTHLTLPTILLV